MRPQVGCRDRRSQNKLYLLALILDTTSTRVLSLQTIYLVVDDSDLTLGKVQKARDESLEDAMMATS